MTRKIKRSQHYELSLQITDDGFIRPPRDAQRNWLLNRAIKEFADDLDALDRIAGGFVAGGDPAELTDRSNTTLADDQIMEDWQIPVMRAMVDAVCAGRSEVLEIGFGRGVAADFIQQRGMRSHTVVECNDSVIERFHRWRKTLAAIDADQGDAAFLGDREIRLIAGRWQDTRTQFANYDGILFHTYPLNEGEFIEYVAHSATFAEHFFDTAAAHLNPGGLFTYLSNEIDSLSRAHQRALLQRFSRFTVSRLDGLAIPADTRDAQWADRTVLVVAEK